MSELFPKNPSEVFDIFQYDSITRANIDIFFTRGGKMDASISRMLLEAKSNFCELTTNVKGGEELYLRKKAELKPLLHYAEYISNIYPLQGQGEYIVSKSDPDTVHKFDELIDKYNEQLTGHDKEFSKMLTYIAKAHKLLEFIPIMSESAAIKREGLDPKWLKIIDDWFASNALDVNALKEFKKMTSLINIVPESTWQKYTTYTINLDGIKLTDSDKTLLMQTLTDMKPLRRYRDILSDTYSDEEQRKYILARSAPSTVENTDSIDSFDRQVNAVNTCLTNSAAPILRRLSIIRDAFINAQKYVSQKK